MYLKHTKCTSISVDKPCMDIKCKFMKENLLPKGQNN